MDQTNSQSQTQGGTQAQGGGQTQSTGQAAQGQTPVVPQQPVAVAPVQPAPVAQQPVVQQPAVAQPVQPVAPVAVAQPPVSQPVVALDLSTIQTKTGKGIADFEIPEALIQNDPSLIDLVIRSESMNDGERQYWFNLTEIMSPEQTEKLRGILTREREKLAEIEAKYGKPKIQFSPEEVAAKNAEIEQKREEQQRRLAQREQQYQEKETAQEDAILAELESL